MPANALIDSDFLADLDEVRGIAGELGLRVYSASLFVTKWSGNGVGRGTSTVIGPMAVNNTATTSGDPPPPVRIRQLSRKEVIASGGLYSDRDLRVGPLTPAFAATMAQFGGGYSDPMVDPEATTSPTEVRWQVKGPTLPAAGATFSKIGEEATSMHYFVILRQSGKTGP